MFQQLYEWKFPGEEWNENEQTKGTQCGSRLKRMYRSILYLKLTFHSALMKQPIPGCLSRRQGTSFRFAHEGV